MNKVKNAFTLVEILVVILIIGILFALLVPAVYTAVNRTKETAIKMDFQQMATAATVVFKESNGGIKDDSLDVAKSKYDNEIDYTYKFTDYAGTDTIGSLDVDGLGKKDSWNHEYKIAYLENGYLIASSGPDEELNTDDDYKLYCLYNAGRDGWATFGFSKNVEWVKNDGGIASESELLSMIGSNK